MSYSNAIADIAPRSLWIDDGGGLAQVLTAAARHVSYRLVGPIRPLLAGLVQSSPEDASRARYRPPYDRAQVRSQFTMSCANLGAFRVYWMPARRRIVARSESCTRQFAIPDGAILVGVYSSPCPPRTFFDDLDELIARDPAALALEEAPA